MIWLFVAAGAVAVLVVAFVALGATVGRLEREAPPAIYELEEAVEYIAERLPDEVEARVSYDDVRTVLGWHLDWFAEVGLATRYGEELGDVAVADGDWAVADEEAAVNAVVARAIDADGPDAVDVVCILDLQMRYLSEIGAVGAAVDEDPPGPTADS